MHLDVGGAQHSCHWLPLWNHKRVTAVVHLVGLFSVFYHCITSIMAVIFGVNLRVVLTLTR